MGCQSSSVVNSKQADAHRVIALPTFIGTPMLQHTLDRADHISDPKQKVTVIARSHRGHAWPQLARRRNGKVILQPANRDTAGGIFAALSYVRALDPQATVVIYPSDHFVYPECRFIETGPAPVTPKNPAQFHDRDPVGHALQQMQRKVPCLR